MNFSRSVVYLGGFAVGWLVGWLVFSLFVCFCHALFILFAPLQLLPALDVAFSQKLVMCASSPDGGFYCF